MTDIYVSSSEELYAALAKAEAGLHIYLEAGEYEDIALWYGLGIDLDLKGITITSATPDDPAVIHAFEATGVSNLTITDVVFDYDYTAGHPVYKRPFEFIDCSNITLESLNLDGDIARDLSPEADGYGSGIGLSVRGCDGFTFADSTIAGFMIGASFGNSTSVRVTGNDISEMRVDGLTFTKMQDVLISGNTIHDFARNLSAGDHSDMIQFWTNGNVTPTTDIRILDNLLSTGDGDPTQGIFMGNEALHQGFGEEMFYDRLQISGNTLLLKHLNGIYVGGSKDLMLNDNALLNPDEDAEFSSLPRIRVDANSAKVTITGNLVEDIWGYTGQQDWQLDGNSAPNTDLSSDAALVSTDTTVCRFLPPTATADTLDFITDTADTETNLDGDVIPSADADGDAGFSNHMQDEFPLTQSHEINSQPFLSDADIM